MISGVGFVDTPIDNHSVKFAGNEKCRLLLRSRPSLTAVQLVCLAGDVVLRAPVETAASIGCWSCGSCLVPGRGG